MKISKTMLAFALVVTVTAGAYAQTAEEIVDRYIKVTGGKEKHASIESVRAVGTYAIPAMGLEMDYTRIMDRPNKLRIEISGQMGKMIQAYSGEVAWVLNTLQGQTEPTIVEGTQADMIEAEAGVDGFLLNREANGVELEYIGEETASGQKLHNVKVTMPGMSFNAYFDAETGLQVKTVATIEMQGQEIQAVNTMSDYREIDGLLTAHRTEISLGGQEVVITIDEHIYNEEYGDSLFDFPAK